MKDFKRLQQRKAIFTLFLEKERIKFNEIEKQLKIRSNKLSYYLRQLVKENLLRKENDSYILTKEAEKYLPIFSREEHLIPIPVILVKIYNKNKMLLIQRKKRPYKEYWCMIGGKIYSHETIKQATLRLAQEKALVKGTFKGIKRIMHERVIDNKEVKHSFILFFTEISTKSQAGQTNAGQIQWVEKKDLKNLKIVPSDYFLLTKRSKQQIIQFDMKDKAGNLIPI